jgi:hypothetical protein
MTDKNLQLDSRFSMIGAFWSPETPDTIMKGTLVSDEREINFITTPEYERPISIGPGTFAMPDSTMIPALHGFTEDGLFTLCQLVEQAYAFPIVCWPVSKNIPKPPRIVSGYLVDGIAFQANPKRGAKLWKLVL